jgi:hypothetical protein
MGPNNFLAQDSLKELKWVSIETSLNACSEYVLKKMLHDVCEGNGNTKHPGSS